MDYPIDIISAVRALRAGEVTSVELVEHAIGAAEAYGRTLGTFVTRFVGEARKAAQAADEAFKNGTAGPLNGIPLGVKDIISTIEGPTTGQSLIQDHAWGDGDAPVVARLRAAGGIIMGKTTTMEFGCGLPDASKPFPLPRNPWNVSRWAGGSSSGTANGLVAGMFLGGVGTDTGGSVRIPSAFCGVTGLKPTYGRVPKSGCLPLGFTLDHVGPMAGSARDCAVLLGAMAGYDSTDLTSIDEPVADYQSGLSGDLSGLRIGVDRLDRMVGTAEDPALPAVFAAAVISLAERGAEVVEIEVPLYREMNAALGVIIAGEMLAFHRPDARTRLADYAAHNRITLGNYSLLSGADYVSAQKLRQVAHRAIMDLFEMVDLIVTPTASVGAIAFADLDHGTAPWYVDNHTAYWDAIGNPALSVPMGFNDGGLPLGLQIVGRPFDEHLVLKAGDAYQAVTDWHRRRPLIETQVAKEP